MKTLFDRVEELLTGFYMWLRRWPEWAVATAVIFGCMLLIFGRLLARPDRMIWGSDFVQFYVWEDFTRSELAAGRLPQWNPYFFSGYPALANPQMMVFYPVAMALRLLPLSYAFGVGIALHIGWGGLGMYWLTRKQGLSRVSAFVTSIAFMLSGIVIPHITGGHVEWLYTIGWLPWVLLTWQQVIREPRLTSALWAAVTTAMLVLGGALRVIVCAGVMVAMLMVIEGWQVFVTAYPRNASQYANRAVRDTAIIVVVVLGLLMIVESGGAHLFPSLLLPALMIMAVVAFEVWDRLLINKQRDPALRSTGLRVHGFATVASTALGLGLAVGLTAPQLLPSLELASLSSRAGGLPLECATDLSLLTRELLYIGFPQLPFDTVLEWERHSYIGAMGFGLALLGLFVRNASLNSAWKLTLIIWGVAGLYLSVGPESPVYQLFHLLPIANLVRQPFTFVVLVSFAGAGLAGLGCEWIVSSLYAKVGGLLDKTEVVTTWGMKNRYRLLAWLGIALWFVIALAIDVALYRRTPSPSDPSFYGLINWLAMFSTPRVLLVAIILLWQFGGRRWLLVTAIIGLLFIDLWLFAYGRISFIPAVSPQVQAGATPQVSIAEARVLTTPYTFSNLSMAVRTGNAQGYAPIVVETYRAFNTGAGPQSGCPSFENAEVQGGDTHLLGLLSVQYVIDANDNVVETYNPLPRAQWVASADGVGSSTEAIVQARKPDYNPAQLIYVEGQGTDLSGGTGTVRITDYQTQSVTLDVESTSDGWVYLNDVWYPGWDVTVNEEPGIARVYRANGTFRAVRVAAGHYRLVMTFQSTYLNWGLIICVITLIGLIGLAIGSAIRSRAQLAAPSAPAGSE